MKLSTTSEVLERPISKRKSIPRITTDNYSFTAVSLRREFVKEFTGVQLEHMSGYTFSPQITKGNCENFVGVAQIPVGLAGPVKVNGEYAQDEFLVPMATTEGTLVASYNRGMAVLNMCGGALVTIQDDAMQRAPTFIFDTAREARDFLAWIKENTDQIAFEAESTSRVAKLKYIDPYLFNHFVFLRFNYSTGDAAGQNMVGKATNAACEWILANYQEHQVRQFYLDTNFASDKKASQINTLKTRGKRVTAEIILKDEVLRRIVRTTAKDFVNFCNMVSTGAMLSGANNNGFHSANGIAAMFIAMGQDVANVAESSTAVLHASLTASGDCHLSITLPSLIIATHGGGTGLATQQEALKMLGCTGQGSVKKLAEIMAATVLAGEISLASAVLSQDWVSSHEQFGRNR